MRHHQVLIITTNNPVSFTTQSKRSPDKYRQQVYRSAPALLPSHIGIFQTSCRSSSFEIRSTVQASDSQTHKSRDVHSSLNPLVCKHVPASQKATQHTPARHSTKSRTSLSVNWNISTSDYLPRNHPAILYCTVCLAYDSNLSSPSQACFWRINPAKLTQARDSSKALARSRPDCPSDHAACMRPHSHHHAAYKQ